MRIIIKRIYFVTKICDINSGNAITFWHTRAIGFHMKSPFLYTNHPITNFHVNVTLGLISSSKTSKTKNLQD